MDAATCPVLGPIHGASPPRLGRKDPTLSENPVSGEGSGWHLRSWFKSLALKLHHNLYSVLIVGRNEQSMEKVHTDTQRKLSGHKREPFIYI